jgi:hypothetical protein
MKQQPIHIKEPLSKEILLAYLEGSLPDVNMQEVKELVDSNPLYKDALDGLRWMDNPDDIHSILPTLKTARTKGKIVTLPRLAMAAGIALLVTGGILAVRLAQHQQSQSLFAEHFEKPDTAAIIPEAQPKDADPVPDSSQNEPVAAPGTTATKPVQKPTEITPEVMNIPEISMVEDEAPQDFMADTDAAENVELPPVPEKPATPSIQERQKQAAGNAVITAAAEPSRDVSPISTIKALYQANNFADALTEADEALKYDPVNPELYLYKGLAHLGLEQAAEAKRSFDKVLALDDGFQDTAEWYKALALVKLGDRKEARKLLTSIANGPSPFAVQAAELLKDF